MRIAVVILALLSVLSVKGADALPSDNRFNWAFCGVPGGIPHRTTIYTNLTSSASASTINTHISNCPSNQVVFLEAGTYSLTAKLTMKTGVTLRGATNAAGWPTTILNFTSAASGDGLVDFAGSYPANNWAAVSDVTLSSGYTKGSSSVVCSGTPTGLSAGMVAVIDALDDEDLVRNTTTTQGAGVMGGRDGNRCMMQFVYVTNVSGTTVQFEPPIYSTYYGTLSTPGMYWYTTANKWAGVEDLEINRNSADSTFDIVHMALAYACWERNVKSTQCDRSHVRTAWTMNCEIRDCYFTVHDDVGAATYSVYATYTGALKVENNIMFTIPCAIGLQATQGSYFGYNFSTNFPYSTSTWLPECMMQHAAHSHANLWEGNWVPSFWSDLIHGNSSYCAHIRNRVDGMEAGKTGNIQPINLEAQQDFMAYLGNVLGLDGTHVSYETTAPEIWNVDADSDATLIRLGNYNTVNDTIPAGESLGGNTISNSYVHVSKPAWFGDRTWPWVDPVSTGTSLDSRDYTNFPAGYRFEYSEWPPAESGGGEGSTSGSGKGRGTRGSQGRGRMR